MQRLEREVSARQLQLQQLQKQLQLAAAEKLEVEQVASAKKLEAERTASKLSIVEEQLRGAQQEASALKASHASACVPTIRRWHLSLAMGVAPWIGKRNALQLLTARIQ